MLALYDGSPVPFQVSPLPNPDASQSNCWFVLSDGNLALNAAAGTFSYTLTFRHSCTNAVLSSGTVTGTFLQSGETLTLTTSTGSGFDGEVRRDTVTLRGDHDYGFTKRK